MACLLRETGPKKSDNQIKHATFFVHHIRSCDGNDEFGMSHTTLKHLSHLRLNISMVRTENVCQNIQLFDESARNQRPDQRSSVCSHFYGRMRCIQNV